MGTTPDYTTTSVHVVDRLTPGGRLQWVINRLLPGGSSAPVLLETLSDGQQIDGTFTPTLTLLNGTTVLSTAALQHWTWVQDPSTGVTTVSADLQGVSLAGATRVAITFQTVVSQALISTAPLSRLVGQGDTLSGSGVFLGDAAASSDASITLPTGVLSTSVYAVNGELVPAGSTATAAIGDAVTYRLRFTLPLTAAQNVKVTAVPPGVAGSLVFDNTATALLPATGHAQWGPSATYTAVRPSITTGPGGLSFNFGDVLPLYGSGGTAVDLLFTTTLTGVQGSAPLQLQATETESNSFGTVSSSAATASLALEPPHLLLQTGTLYASREGSVFTGTGGPGYSHYTGQFSDVVSSATLAVQPFADTLSGVDAGDLVTFVIAVQNVADRAGAYDVLLRDTMPSGFRIPDGGADVTVVDGAGHALAATGNLFDPAGGLLIGAPVARFDPTSGGNVALVTFTLQAAATLSTPRAALQNTAQVVRYAALPGGADVSAGYPATDAAASTPVTTAEPTISIQQAAGGSALQSGDLATFNITLALPEGRMTDLQLDEFMPQGAGAWFSLVSARVVSVGANLSTTVQPGATSSTGHFSFGTVLNTPDNQDSAADTITLQVTARGVASGTGTATMQAMLSAADPNGSALRWSNTASSSATVAGVNTAPAITGASSAQRATSTMQVHPFAPLTLADPDAGQTETLIVQLSDPLLGGFGTPSIGHYNALAGTYVVTGSIAAVQQAVRDLVLTPATDASGIEAFTVTVNDGAGGITRDSGTTIQITPAALAAAAFQHNAALPTATFVTEATGGGSTQIGGEVYSGPVGYLQSQFIYDGADSVAIVAQTPDTFIKIIAAGSAAVQLLSGRNVVDAGHGSNFITSGTGPDTIFLDGRTSGVTWDTIVGFHSGDMAVIWGYHPGTSTLTWESDGGSAGYTGQTLHSDLAGTGQVNASLTFAGKTAADVAGYAVTTGSVGGNDYLAVIAL